MSNGLSSRGRALSIAAVVTGVSCAGVCGSAWGSAFGLLEQSASRMGTAFAGTAAAADDASTIFFNPAGLALLDETEALLVVSGVNISSEFNNRNSQAAFAQQLGNDGGDAGDLSVIPAAYLALPINDDLAFGLGVNVPFGLKLEYDDGWMGRFQALKSEIQTYNFNPSLSLRLNEHVSVGFGLNYQRLQAELTNDINYSGVVAQGLAQLVAAGQVPPAAVPGLLAANAGLAGETRVRGDDSAWGFDAGILIEFSPETRLGLSYRSSVDYDLEGSVRFAPPTATNPVGAGIIAAASAPGARLSDGSISVELEVPDSAIASLYHGIGAIELLADVAWTGWSSIQELRIVRDSGAVLSVTPELWEDSWRYSLGVAYQLSDSWKLRGGVAYDETPVRSETRTARLPDPNRKWVAIGAQWKTGDAVVVDVGYAHLFSDDAAIDQDEGNPAASGVLSGIQESSIDILSAQVSYRFGK